MLCYSLWRGGVCRDARHAMRNAEGADFMVNATCATPQWRSNLSQRTRRILSALVRVVIPRNERLHAPIEDEIVDFIDGYVGRFPATLRKLFPWGLYLLEHGTWLFAMTWRTFTRMDPAAQDRYVAGWVNSRFLLKRELIKGVKGLVLLCFYSHEQVTPQLDYRHDEWIASVKERRLARYGDDIRKREELARGEQNERAFCA